MIRSFKIDQLPVKVFESNEALGRAAAEDFAKIVQTAVTAQGEAAVIFATGNSQLTFLDALRRIKTIPWDKITAFHMDEYLGMPEAHPASFRRYINEKITNAFHPRAVYTIQGDAADSQAELTRYAALLDQHRLVLCVLGIGENGHLAFNDPPADFQTSQTIHIVTLDETCRRQQVGEGHFPSLADVPRQAFSLTIPALLKPSHVMALVPEQRKARIVKAALEGEITEQCPASILRTQAHARLYLERDSASLL